MGGISFGGGVEQIVRWGGAPPHAPPIPTMGNPASAQEPSCKF